MQPHVRRRGRPASEAQVWADLGDDIFSLLDEAGDDLRKLRCVDVAASLSESAPDVMTHALRRAVDAWMHS